MTITPSSLSYAVGASIINTNFKAASNALPRKVLCIGTIDPTLNSSLTQYSIEAVVNPSHAAARYGSGFQLAKLIEWVSQEFSGSIDAMIVHEATATESAGSILFAGTLTESGTLHFYVGSEKIENVNLAIGADGEDQVDAIVAAAANYPDLSVTLAKDGTTHEKLNVTAKSGAVGWNFSLGFNYGFGETYPAGTTAPVVTPMAGGAGTIVMATALAALGAGDQANDNHYTAIAFPGSITDTTTLNSLSTWNGVGNTVSGNYGKLVARPVRALIGDNTAGSGGLTTLLALGLARKETDRTTGVMPVPGSPSHPVHIACAALGACEEIASIRPGQPYMKTPLKYILPGSYANNWCADFDDRETAKQAGIGSTLVVGSSVMLNDVVTFYHSASIPVASNGYREFSNISIIQNLLNDVKTNFSSDRWVGVSAVADKAKVTDIIARIKARDTSDVIDDLMSLLYAWEGKAYIWSAAWSIAKLQAGGYVALRLLSNGWDIVLPVLLRVPGDVLDTQIQFDANVSIAL